MTVASESESLGTGDGGSCAVTSIVTTKSANGVGAGTSAETVPGFTRGLEGRGISKPIVGSRIRGCPQVPEVPCLASFRFQESTVSDLSMPLGGYPVGRSNASRVSKDSWVIGMLLTDWRRIFQESSSNGRVCFLLRSMAFIRYAKADSGMNHGVLGQYTRTGLVIERLDKSMTI